MLTGQIMDWPLTTTSILRRAAEVFPDSVIVSRTVEGARHGYGYRELLAGAARLAGALRDDLGIKPGDRVATIAWNTYRHLEAYFAISGIGAVCHTLNPRYSPDQLRYILDHAEDVAVLCDTSFAPLLEALLPDNRHVKHVVTMTDAGHMPDGGPAGAHCYDTLVAASAGDFDWPALDENTAAGLCYTSGTTGDPKGALYSHRSSVLNALCSIAAVPAHFSEHDRILAVVPLFHANAWGLPFAAPISGTSLVLPGPNLDGASLYDLMADEGVTAAWGVPTVWNGLLAEIRARGAKPPALQRLIVGGSAVSESFIREMETDYRVDVTQGWGMTEMSPVGSLGTLSPSKAALSADDRFAIKAKQGRPLYGVEMRIVDEAGDPLPHDGAASGELQVRGAAIIGAYFRAEEATAQGFTPDGWLRTGDIASIDPDGAMKIVDRAKDMIKSGGEWISSIDLENVAKAHPAVADCCVIGIAHPHWEERPLLLVVARDGAAASEEDLRSFLAERVAKIAVPDAVVFVDAFPLTATGKVAKRALRETHKDHYRGRP